jgi:hypothetical protein
MTARPGIARHCHEHMLNTGCPCCRTCLSPSHVQSGHRHLPVCQPASLSVASISTSCAHMILFPELEVIDFLKGRQGFNSGPSPSTFILCNRCNSGRDCHGEFEVCSQENNAASCLQAVFLVLRFIFEDNKINILV